MQLPEFAMERLQATHERSVRFDLSESGVEALTLAELVPSFEELGRLPLGYADGRGRAETRALVAAFHAGAGADDVLLTTGTSEANFLALCTLVGPGDEVVIVMPTYLQAHGIARGLGARVREVWLREEHGWRIDLDALAGAVNDRTRAICVCQPNNPTAQRLSAAEVAGIARLAAAHGAWILSDEVFRGAELADGDTASFSGLAERVIVTGGLSKVYGLPGLRIGWMVAPADRIAAALSLKDYTTIAPATLSEVLAEHALAGRDRLVARARSLARGRWPALEAWARRRQGELRWTPPQAGTVCFFSYDRPGGSVELAEQLIREGSTLVVPGAHFGAERHIRIGFGMPARVLDGGLEQLDGVLSRALR